MSPKTNKTDSKRVPGGQAVIKASRAMMQKMLDDLKAAKAPHLEAIKCSLDNAIYDPKVGYLTPGDKIVSTDLNVSSVKKMARTVFMLELLINNAEMGACLNLREYYYLAKGEIKHHEQFKPLDFEDQGECDDIIYFICEMLECYREDFNCFANDRGSQCFSRGLIVTERMPDGSKITIDLSQLGTNAFQPKNRPQDLTLSVKKGEKIDYCLIVESEGTANSFVSNGFIKRNNAIIVGAQGVPSNAVRGWCKLIQDQLSIPMYFFGDLDAYTVQNIFRTLKAGSAASMIRNEHFSAPEVKFLGVLPEDVKRYDLPYYKVNPKDEKEARSLKKAKDALQDPFFKDKNNQGLTDILKWLYDNQIRCEQQALYSVDPKNIKKPEEILIEKIKNKSYV
jgi:DNA topoisomerase-6 subunit A